LERVRDLDPTLAWRQHGGSSRGPLPDIAKAEGDPLAPLELELRASAPKPLLNLALALLHSLDERGYLSTPLAQLAAEWAVDENRLEPALSVLHDLDVPGLGERSLQECLLMQCEYLQNTGVPCPLPIRL